MAKKEIIRVEAGYDFDGVLARSDKPVLTEVNRRLNSHLVSSDLKDYNFVRDFALLHTGSEKQADEINELWFEPTILRRSPPNKSVIFAFNLCHRLLPDVDQHVITTRRPNCHQISLDWLNQFIPKIDWLNHFHIRDPQSVESGDEFKVGKIEEHNIVHFAEDFFVTARNITTKCPSCRISLVTQPWNRSDHEFDHLRVSPDNWAKMFCNILRARQQFYASIRT
jgi:hypothetical protein